MSESQDLGNTVRYRNVLLFSDFIDIFIAGRKWDQPWLNRCSRRLLQLFDFGFEFLPKCWTWKSHSCTSNANWIIHTNTYSADAELIGDTDFWSYTSNWL